VYHLSAFVTHLRRVLPIPVNHIFVCQNHNVTLSISMLSCSDHLRQNHLFEKSIELLSCTIV